MYCDIWPYVLWPLDFQIQKRIVAAETIWGNTVYGSLAFGNFGHSAFSKPGCSRKLYEGGCQESNQSCFYLINTFGKIQAEGYNVASTVYGSLSFCNFGHSALSKPRCPRKLYEGGCQEWHQSCFDISTKAP